MGSALALAGPVEFFADPDWTSAEALWLLYPLLPFTIASVAPLGQLSIRRVLFAWLTAAGAYLLVGAIAVVDPDPLGIILLVFLSPLLISVLVILVLVTCE